jgi:hypothetical protein
MYRDFEFHSPLTIDTFVCPDRGQIGFVECNLVESNDHCKRAPLELDTAKRRSRDEWRKTRGRREEEERRGETNLNFENDPKNK